MQIMWAGFFGNLKDLFNLFDADCAGRSISSRTWVGTMGWVDFDFAFCLVLIVQNWLSGWARLWNIPNISQLNPVRQFQLNSLVILLNCRPQKPKHQKSAMAEIAAAGGSADLLGLGSLDQNGSGGQNGGGGGGAVNGGGFFKHYSFVSHRISAKRRDNVMR